MTLKAQNATDTLYSDARWRSIAWSDAFSVYVKKKAFKQLTPLLYHGIGLPSLHTQPCLTRITGFPKKDL